MTKKQKAALAVAALEKEYPDALCSLEEKEPYRLLIAVRLSAQCTDARVNLVTPVLFERFPTLESLAFADVAEVEEIVHPCGFFRAKANDIVSMSRMLIEKYDSKVPDTIEELVKLPGVGRKTANLIVGEKETVGFVHINYRTGNTAWIEDIYVDELKRGQGIATRVIGLAEDKIKFHRGYTSICLEASPDNKAALALYHKLGYITLGMITVRKEIYKNDKNNETELFGLTYKY